MLFNVRNRRTLRERGGTFADHDRDVFIEERTARPSRFEKAINKTKILNFATENILKRERQSSLLKLQISQTIAKYL